MARIAYFLDGAGTKGWRRVRPTSGPTSQRPVDGMMGDEHFDTALGKPVWLKATPSTWVDATGTTV